MLTRVQLVDVVFPEAKQVDTQLTEAANFEVIDAKSKHGDWLCFNPSFTCRVVGRKAMEPLEKQLIAIVASFFPNDPTEWITQWPFTLQCQLTTNSQFEDSLR